MRTLGTHDRAADRKIHMRVAYGSGGFDLTPNVIEARWWNSASGGSGGSLRIRDFGTTGLTRYGLNVRVRIYTAATMSDTPPSSTSSLWMEVFDGVVTRSEMSEPHVIMTLRDRRIHQARGRWVEEERTYGTETGTPAHTVISQILSHWTDGLTLDTPTFPTFLLRERMIRPQPVLTAINYIADTFGWIVRQGWTGTAFELQLLDPQRNVRSSALSLASSEYNVNRYSWDLQNVRNVIQVVYGDNETVTQQNVVSISSYGRRFMRMREEDTSQIDTLGEATAFATDALTELAFPQQSAEIEMRYFGNVELEDWIGLTGIGVYVTDGASRTYAVTDYRHTISEGAATTTITMSEHSVGAQNRWLLRDTEPGVETPAIDYDGVDLALEVGTQSIVNVQNIIAVNADAAAFKFDVVTDWRDISLTEGNIGNEPGPAFAFSRTLSATDLGPWTMQINVDRGVGRGYFNLFIAARVGTEYKDVKQVDLNPYLQPAEFIVEVDSVPDNSMAGVPGRLFCMPIEEENGNGNGQPPPGE